MGGAFLASQDGQGKLRVRSSHSQKPSAELLVDLSNVPLNPGTRAVNTENNILLAEKCKTPRSSFGFSLSTKNGTRVHSENSSLHFDGQTDNGNETPTSEFSNPFLFAPKPIGTSRDVPSLYEQTPDDEDASPSETSLRAYAPEDTDLIDLSSDTESFVSKSTVEPQSPRTPDVNLLSLPFEFRNESLKGHSQTYGLNTRLRPSQRIPGFSAYPRSFEMKDRMSGRRRPPTASRDSFLMSRPVSKLTQSQKLLRRRTGLSDPFEPVVSRSPTQPRQSQSGEDRGITRSGSFRATRALGLLRTPGFPTTRQTSGNSVWSIGGSASVPTAHARHGDGPRTVASSRAHGRVHTSKFLRGSGPGDDIDMHEKRLALALDVDQAEKILATPSNLLSTIRSIPLNLLANHGNLQGGPGYGEATGRLVWKDNVWMRNDGRSLLEAPLLRDDFYCSVLAYSYKADRLAVALGFKVYLWSEAGGTIEPPTALDVTPLRSAYISSLAFSSESGGRAILAVGRGDGRILLWSPIDPEPRFLRLRTPNAAAHLSFRPAVIRRPSQRHEAIMAENEVFLAGDDLGTVSIYFVEWPDDSKRFLFGWHGSVLLHARVTVHSQQICGIAWSPNGDFFATGGNDNLCCLFQHSTILRTADHRHAPASIDSRRDAHGNTHMTVLAENTTGITIRSEHVKNQWKLNAAVKAMAFCPWQPGLLAAGGGSNDRCIHFYHTFSGACLDTIDCAAQVTALVWSTTRREIAATFGFAQPEHPFRVAVYSWPSCEQILAIPWMSEMRALHAISYPGRPDYGQTSRAGRDQAARYAGHRAARYAEEGCIVIAGSDGSIKFHEVWSEERRATTPHQGLLGGSDILESLHGIDKEGRETIR